MSITINEIVEYARKVSNGEHETVKPGDPFAFSEASSVGDTVWQGDMAIAIVDNVVPEGYTLGKPTKNLVPGNDNTIGSRHCLASTQGVTMYFPKDWSDESLEGPFVQIKTDAVVTHPVHGDVTVPATFGCFQIFYQREWDAEQARIRRASD